MKKEIEAGLLARINAAVLSYYQKAEKYKTEKNFRAWLQSFGYSSLRLHFEQLGFERSKSALSFMRFVLELNDHGLNRHMKANLSEDDFNQWVNPSKNMIVPKEMNILDPDDLSKLV
jgi:hypothetical protein